MYVGDGTTICLLAMVLRCVCVGDGSTIGVLVMVL